MGNTSGTFMTHEECYKRNDCYNCPWKCPQGTPKRNRCDVCETRCPCCNGDCMICNRDCINRKVMARDGRIISYSECREQHDCSNCPFPCPDESADCDNCTTRCSCCVADCSICDMACDNRKQ